MKKVKVVVGSHFFDQIRKRLSNASDKEILDILKKECQEGELYKHHDGGDKIYLSNVGVSIPIAKGSRSFFDYPHFFALSVYNTISPHSLNIRTKEIKIRWYHFKDTKS